MNTQNNISSFCKYCSKSSFDNKTGYYCTLTNEKPNFHNDCPHFVKDPEKVLKHRKLLSLNARGSNNFWDWIKNSIHPNFNTNNVDNVYIRYSKIKFILSFIFFVTLWIFLIVLINNNNSITTARDFVEVFIMTGMAPALIFLLFVFEYRRTFVKKFILHFSSKGLAIKDQLISWERVIGFSMYYIRYSPKNHYETFLEIEVIGKELDIKIEVDKLSISRYQLIQILRNVQKMYLD